jgi:hypothetical protein
MKLLSLTITTILLFAGFSTARTTQQLFYIERNKNSNKVYYEAIIDSNGMMEKHVPIHIYWILWAQDSTGNKREELSLIEKNMGYGLKMSPNKNRKFFTASLSAFPDRSIVFRMVNNKAVAEIIINGRNSYIDKVYINSRETKMFPKVNYIEIFGRDVKTNEAMYEKITPK